MASPPETAGGDKDALRSGEIAAWMAQYGPALRRYFARRAEPADTEDLVQEVFLRMQAREQEATIDNVERYLFKIARNVLISRNRHDRIDGLWRHDALDEAADAPDDLSPERILAGKQAIERAAVAILNLPPRTRAAFEFHRFEKLSYSAIAQRMGISKGAVQDLMQRAIDRLADEFGEDK